MSVQRVFLSLVVSASRSSSLMLGGILEARIVGKKQVILTAACTDRTQSWLNCCSFLSRVLDPQRLTSSSPSCHSSAFTQVMHRWPRSHESRPSAICALSALPVVTSSQDSKLQHRLSDNASATTRTWQDLVSNLGSVFGLSWIIILNDTVSEKRS